MLQIGIAQHGYPLLSIVLFNTVALSSKYESLTHIYETYNEEPILHHYYNYGPAYDESIQHLREEAVRQGKKVKMLEIGVQSGGSTRVWKRYFRKSLAYVGLDINPRCKQMESLDEGIRIVIGSQLNTTLLSDICSTYGPFDLVIDDGGHANDMIITSLLSLWDCLNDNAVYVIEDLHSLNMKRGNLLEGEVNVFQILAEWMKIRSPGLHYKDSPQKAKMIEKHPAWHLKNLQFYDSILFLHYADEVPPLEDFEKGWHRVYLPTSRHKETKPCKGCCVGCYDN